MTRIAVINGGNIVGYATQRSDGSIHNMPLLSLPQEDNGRRAIIIKLPREIVDSCGRLEVNRHRSLAFSFKENITGRQAVIWCTGDKDGFRCAYIGTIDGAGTEHEGKGRNFVLKDSRQIHQSEWNEHFADKVKKKTKR